MFAIALKTGCARLEDLPPLVERKRSNCGIPVRPDIEKRKIHWLSPGDGPPPGDLASHAPAFATTLELLLN